MGELAAQVTSVLLGFGGFSIEVWAGITVLVLLAGASILAAAPEAVDPMGVQAGTDPGKVRRWLILTPLLHAAIFLILVISILGVPLAVIWALLVIPVAGLFGYIGVATLWGDRLYRFMGKPQHPVIAGLTMLLIFRLVRLVPYIGGIIHGGIVLYGLAASTIVMTERLIAWHQRRMPDDRQFRGGQVVEWDDPSGPRIHKHEPE